MKTKIILSLLFLVLGFNQILKAQKENEIVGLWLSEPRDAKIQIFKSSNNKYYGKLIWGARMYEKDGKTSRLAKNGKPFKDLLMLQEFILMTVFGMKGLSMIQKKVKHTRALLRKMANHSILEVM